ncbi:hypothetical protein RN001_010646 [Aquatica leii]|uniref:V(D)J recombination-activating protein 1 RNase H domain-containing protein n=1 Tax=Aquatica leii TaxID=1421715 RepID=A0AAN7P1A3_9COLE|nr:hypothetical protein RN001_010646 [Aquatica leii]
MFATSRSLHKSGKRDAAKILDELETTPKRAFKIKKAFHSPAKSIIPYTPEEALALYIDGHCTKNSYMLMQSGAKLRNANIYPSYDTLKIAKQSCYSNKDSITITDMSAEVRLQILVDHTVRRLIEAHKDVVNHIIATSQDFSIIYKWGCDGSANHSTYKQQLTSQYLFAVCIVPLQLKAGKAIIWQNPRPSSVRYCRPIKIVFNKETTEIFNKEINIIEKQIKEILPTKLKINNKDIHVNHMFKLTMIDGKTFSVISKPS